MRAELLIRPDDGLLPTTTLATKLTNQYLPFAKTRAAFKRLTLAKLDEESISHGNLLNNSLFRSTPPFRTVRFRAVSVERLLRTRWEATPYPNIAINVLRTYRTSVRVSQS